MKMFITAGIVALVIAATATTTVFASGARFFSGEQKESGQVEITEREPNLRRGGIDKDSLTDEQLAEIEEWFASRPEMPDIKEGRIERPEAGKFSALTDEQKAELNELTEEKSALSEAYVVKAVDAGIITQEQAYAMLNKQNKRGSAMLGISGFRFNDSECSDEQKAVIEEYNAAMKEISLKEIDMYVKFGILTEEAAASMKEKLSSFSELPTQDRPQVLPARPSKTTA